MQEEEAEPVKFKDFFLLFKENKPMVVYYLKGVFPVLSGPLFLPRLRIT